MLNRIRNAQVAWLNVRLSLEFTAAAREWIDDDLISALLVAGVVSANAEAISHKPADLRRFVEPGGVPDEYLRPVNVLSVALSLGVPRETARVKIAALLEQGILVKRGNGVILSSTVVLSEPFMMAMARFLRAIAEFVEGLATIGACGVLEGDRIATPPWSIGGVASRLVTAHVLRGIDYVHLIHPDVSLTSRYVFLAMAHLTGATLRLSPAAPGAHAALAAFQPALGPITIADLARFTGFDDETTRRHVDRLETKGAVLRVHNGRDINLSDPGRVARWLEFQSRTKVSSNQLVWKLYLAGVIIRGSVPGPSSVSR